MGENKETKYLGRETLNFFVCGDRAFQLVDDQRVREGYVFKMDDPETPIPVTVVAGIMEEVKIRFEDGTEEMIPRDKLWVKRR